MRPGGSVTARQVIRARHGILFECLTGVCARVIRCLWSVVLWIGFRVGTVLCVVFVEASIPNGILIGVVMPPSLDIGCCAH